MVGSAGLPAELPGAAPVSSWPAATSAAGSKRRKEGEANIHVSALSRFLWETVPDHPVPCPSLGQMPLGARPLCFPVTDQSALSSL